MSLGWYAFIPKDVTPLILFDFCPLLRLLHNSLLLLLLLLRPYLQLWTEFWPLLYSQDCICPDEYTAQSPKCVKVLHFAEYFELVLILQHAVESQKIRSASLLFLHYHKLLLTFETIHKLYNVSFFKVSALCCSYWVFLFYFILVPVHYSSS